jgi:hypothetical protein
MNIKQKPLYKMVAADEEIIFVVEDNANVRGAPGTPHYKVKFIAEIYLTIGGNATSTLPSDKIATLKASPNNAGVGIFDFSRILEAYVSPDYLGGETIFWSGVQYYSKYNQSNYSDARPHSIHQIDEFSNSRKGVRNFAIKFSIEFATSQTGTLSTVAGLTSDAYYIHNAVRQEDDTIAIESTTGNFGYNYDFNNFVIRHSSAKFLTNSPTTQYIGSADYHTLAFFQESGTYTGANTLYGNKVGSGSATIKSVDEIKIQFYSGGSTTGSLITLDNNFLTGGHFANGDQAKNKVVFVGVGTGNIAGAGNTVPTNWDYYEVYAKDDALQTVSNTYYFYNQCDGMGFEKFRVTWLNRLGTWDYFNFTKKNVRKVNSKRETYQQLKGTWNETTYKKYGYQGGQKTFSTNSKEVITLQSDFVTEEVSAWLEELFTSPDVFVLQERSTDKAAGLVNNILNKYVQPCVVKSSSYTKKTTANDKLKQYTLEIEMSHNKRIQRS